MTREEILAKLSAIKICVVNITYTYDIGLLFDVMTHNGVYSEGGYNVGMWPCIRLSVNDEIRDLQKRIISDEPISNEELIESDFVKELCTFRGVHGSGVVEGKALEFALSEIKKQLHILDCSGDHAFAYISLYDWDTEVALFSSYEKLQDYFIEKWGMEDSKWEDMDDEELEQWYEMAKEEDWECLPYTDVV